MDETRMRQIAQEVYQSMGTRFGVSQVPYHTHNGTDSPTLPQFSAISTGPNGVFSPGNTAGQIVNLNPTTGIGNTNVSTVPIPVIYGNGVGTASQFNGGNAPVGTIVAFQNDPLVIQLWWRVISTAAGGARWYGVDVSSSGGNAVARGPLP